MQVAHCEECGDPDPELGAHAASAEEVPRPQEGSHHRTGLGAGTAGEEEIREAEGWWRKTSLQPFVYAKIEVGRGRALCNHLKIRET